PAAAVALPRPPPAPGCTRRPATATAVAATSVYASSISHAKPFPEPRHRTSFHVLRQIALHEHEAPRTRTVLVGEGGFFRIDPGPFQSLSRHLQWCARQAAEQVRPDPHRAGGAVQPGGLVGIVADPHHRQVRTGVAGEPAV